MTTAHLDADHLRTLIERPPAGDPALEAALDAGERALARAATPPDPTDPRAELGQLAGQLRDRPGDDHLAEAVADRIDELVDELPRPVLRLPFEEVAGDAYDVIELAELADHVTVKALLPGEVGGIGVLRFVFGQGRADEGVVTIATVNYAAPPGGLRDLTRLVNTAGTKLARLVEGRD